MNTNNRLSLDVIRVAEPCPESWERMSGDDRVRYCAGCRKHVYNLSAMTRTEAERLVCEGAGSLCVRFGRTETGQVLTLEYSAPPAKKRGWRFWTAVSTVAASVVAGANGYLLARGKPAPPVVVGKPVMWVGGRVAAPPVMGMIAGPVPPAQAPVQQPAPPAASPADPAAG
jgi:hypothetical protein